MKIVDAIFQKCHEYVCQIHRLPSKIFYLKKIISLILKKSPLFFTSVTLHGMPRADKFCALFERENILKSDSRTL